MDKERDSEIEKKEGVREMSTCTLMHYSWDLRSRPAAKTAIRASNAVGH